MTQEELEKKAEVICLYLEGMNLEDIAILFGGIIYSLMQTFCLEAVMAKGYTRMCRKYLLAALEQHLETLETPKNEETCNNA